MIQRNDIFEPDVPKGTELPVVVNIHGGYLDKLTGEYATPKGCFVCDENPDEFAAYEASFPEKEKLKLPF